MCPALSANYLALSCEGAPSQTIVLRHLLLYFIVLTWSVFLGIVSATGGVVAGGLMRNDEWVAHSALLVWYLNVTDTLLFVSSLSHKSAPQHMQCHRFRNNVKFGITSSLLITLITACVSMSWTHVRMDGSHKTNSGRTWSPMKALLSEHEWCRWEQFQNKWQTLWHFNTALNKGQGGKEIFQIFEVRS